MKQLLEIAERFASSEKISRIEPLKSGNINDTYLVYTSDLFKTGFILQKINSRVFPSPEHIIENIKVLTNHIASEKKKHPKSRYSWRIPDLIRLLPEVVAAKGQAGHERRQHRAHRKDGGAKNMGHHARPHDLIDQTTGTRDKEQAEDCPLP